MNKNILVGIGEQEKISDQVLDLIDFIEIKQIISENIDYYLQFNKPFLFHPNTFKKRKLVWGTDDDFVALFKQDEVKKFINSSKYNWFSFHLGIAKKGFSLEIEGNKYNLIGEGKKFSRQELLEKIKKNINSLKKVYPEFDLAFETPPYLPEEVSNSSFAYICDPDFIKEVIQETNTHFLLDIPHAFVSANNLYFEPKKYFSQLPLEKTIEVHISGAKKFKGENFWRDAHLPIKTQEKKMLEWLIPKMPNIRAIVLEAQGMHPEKIMIKELKIIKSLLN